MHPAPAFDDETQAFTSAPASEAAARGRARAASPASLSSNEGPALCARPSRQPTNRKLASKRPRCRAAPCSRVRRSPKSTHGPRSARASAWVSRSPSPPETLPRSSPRRGRSALPEDGGLSGSWWRPMSPRPPAPRSVPPANQGCAASPPARRSPGPRAVHRDPVTGPPGACDSHLEGTGRWHRVWVQ